MIDQLPDNLKHWVLISDALKRPETVRFTASAEECAEIAKLYSLPDVTAFSFEIEVEAWRKQGLRLKGDLKAEVIQSCVVTLEPVPGTIREEMDICFLPEGASRGRQVEASGKEIMIDPEAEDPPEILTGNRLDVATPAFEHFALALNPYPRLEGAHLPDTEDEDEDDGRESPFAALKGLQGQLKS
ncbi:YceD family protein [Coralliovum pocilloporae]|uniref:YceD family protein n=1 Tax=Coralliovum pocilloporae TaxID=3066369 RepID=UPI00330713C1